MRYVATAVSVSVVFLWIQAAAAQSDSSNYLDDLIHGTPSQRDRIKAERDYYASQRAAAAADKSGARHRQRHPVGGDIAQP